MLKLYYRLSYITDMAFHRVMVHTVYCRVIYFYMMIITPHPSVIQCPLDTQLPCKLNYLKFGGEKARWGKTSHPELKIASFVILSLIFVTEDDFINGIWMTIVH